MLTPLIVAHALSTFREASGTRCPSAMYAVTDDLPVRGNETIKSVGRLVANGSEVGIVFLTQTGHVYIQAYGTMPRAEQRMLRLVVPVESGPRGGESEVIRLQTEIPDGIR